MREYVTLHKEWLTDLAEQSLIEGGYTVGGESQDSFWDIVATKGEIKRLIRLSVLPFYNTGVGYKQELHDFPLPPNSSKEYWQYVGETIGGSPAFYVRFISNGDRQGADCDFKRAYTQF